ncbi:MAG TPA: enoyl-CoA hydratase [Gammaproteobacteria bacterium]|jgi:enoyl-CoA hydratase/carnithine racemase|nr:enoyl-CoA hydratase [Gammaproteobacteria bacterium]
MTKPEPVLLREDTDACVTLTLNRPSQFNALSEELLSALQEALSSIAEDASKTVVVIAANGKAFCAGHDLKQMRANPDKAYYQQLFTQCGEVMKTINAMPQIVVAKVQGIVTAAGCQLVAQCDLAVAVDSARFAVSGINVGLFCSTPAVALSRNMSRKRAMEMLVTGDFIDAATAQDYGLINRMAPQDALDAEVAQLVDRICAKSSVAIAHGKQLFYRQLERDLSGAYAQSAEVMACNMMNEDAAEGIDAFMQKRKPDWKGC